MVFTPKLFHGIISVTEIRTLKEIRVTPFANGVTMLINYTLLSLDTSEAYIICTC